MDDVTVVKLGGSMESDSALDDVAALACSGAAVVVVHGGGAEADRLARQLGVRLAVIESPDGTRSRRTDTATLDVLTKALVGTVKPRLVAGLRARGVRAVGLNGADGGMITAERRQAIRRVHRGRVVLLRDDLSGRVVHVDTALLNLLLGAGFVPVLSPPAGTTEGHLLNVDADQVAAHVANATRARALVLLTDMPGVLANPDDPATVLQKLSKMPPSATGRMRHKVRAALTARDCVSKVVIASGLVDRPVERALAGAGTVIADSEEET